MPHNPTSNGITIRHWEGQGVSRTLERDMQMINTSFIWSWSVPSAAVRNEKEGGPHHQTQCQPCLFKKINFHNFIYVHLAYWPSHSLPLSLLPHLSSCLVILFCDSLGSFCVTLGLELSLEPRGLSRERQRFHLSQNLRIGSSSEVEGVCGIRGTCGRWDSASLKPASDSGFRLVQALSMPYQLRTFSVSF